jgi:hypothetical protein
MHIRERGPKMNSEITCVICKQPVVPEEIAVQHRCISRQNRFCSTIPQRIEGFGRQLLAGSERANAKTVPEKPSSGRARNRLFAICNNCKKTYRRHRMKTRRPDPQASFKRSANRAVVIRSLDRLIISFQTTRIRFLPTP